MSLLRIVKAKSKSLIQSIIGRVVYPNGVPRDINGSIIRFPFAFSRYYKSNYEPLKQEFIENYASGIALDLGAHIGLYTVLLSRKARSVIAFEPTAFTREVLRETLKFNECSNVVVRQEGISSQSGLAAFYDTGDIVSNANSLLPIGIPTQIPTLALDDLSLMVDFIKMDIEGAELLALRGGQRTLRTVKYMTMEVHPELLQRSGATVLEVFNELAPYAPRYLYQGNEVSVEFLCQLKDSFETNVFLNDSK